MNGVSDKFQFSKYTYTELNNDTIMHRPQDCIDYVKNIREPKDIGMSSAHEITWGINVNLGPKTK